MGGQQFGGMGGRPQFGQGGGYAQQGYSQQGYMGGGYGQGGAGYNSAAGYGDMKLLCYFVHSMVPFICLIISFARSRY